MYMKFGRRPVMILTLVIFVAALAGCSAAQTYPQLMALRVLQSFGSGVCEAIPVQLVNEIVLDVAEFFTDVVLPSRKSQ
jgi:MFS family permease